MCKRTIITKLRTKVMEEIKSWTTPMPSLSDKRIMPRFANSDTLGKDVVKYIIRSLFFILTVRFSSVLLQALSSLCIKGFTFISDNGYSIKSIIFILSFFVVILFFLVVSTFFAILSYDKNVIKNEKLTNIISTIFLVQALIDMNLLDSEWGSIFRNLLP